MSNFNFFELSPEVAKKLQLQSLPVPIRCERQGEIFPEGGDVELPGILEEIGIYLYENPQYAGVYRQFLAQLCYVVGVDAGTQGYTAQATHYFRMGLDAEPENVSLRVNYALALHCSGHLSEARIEYERVIATTDKDKILPLMWMMLARIYAGENECEKAYWLLKDVSTLIPDQDGFWDFFAEMEEKAGMNKGSKSAPPLDLGAGAKIESVPAPPPQVRVCRNCRKALWPGANFCPGCGTPVKEAIAPPPATAPTCPKCGKAASSNAKFCKSCGANLM